jgi:O-antigen/teichoic acid export membrane protein
MATTSPPRGASTPDVWRTGRALFAAQVASGGLGAVAWLLAARTHAPAEVGAALALVGALSWAGLVGNLGLGSLLVGWLPALRRAERPLISGAAAATAAAVGATLGTTVTLALRGVGGELGLLANRPAVLAALVVGGAAWALGVVADHVAVAVDRPALALGRATVSGAVRLIALIACLLLGSRSAEALVIGWSFAAALGAGVTTVALWARGHLSWNRTTSPAVAGPLVRRSTRTHYGINVLGQSPAMLLPLLLAWRGAPVEAAAFGAAWLLASVVGLLSPAVATGVFAAGAADRANARRVTSSARRQVLATVTGGAVALALLAEPLLSALGPGYGEAAGALRLLAMALVFDAYTNVEVAHLRVTERYRRAIALNGAIAATALIATFVFAPSWGASGAAAAWLAAQALGTLTARRVPRVRRRSRSHAHADMARPRLEPAGTGQRGGAVHPPPGGGPARSGSRGGALVRHRSRPDHGADIRVGPWPGSADPRAAGDGAA